MRKEVIYVMQGFLLFLCLSGIVLFIDHILSLPSRSVPDTAKATHATTSEPVKAVVNTKGKELFQLNCAGCHGVNKELTGPALAKVEERVTDQKLLYAWIRNSEAVLASGNEYFKDLKARYNNIPMSTHMHLSDEDIAAILNYIKEAAAAPSMPVPAAAIILTGNR